MVKISDNYIIEICHIACAKLFHYLSYIIATDKHLNVRFRVKYFNEEGTGPHDPTWDACEPCDFIMEVLL